jgi:hypothetical protein
MTTLNERIAAAAEHFGVTSEEIKSPGRSRNRVIMARQHVMRELRRGGWSLGQIGRTFGRHHTSVLGLTRGFEPLPIVPAIHPLPFPPLPQEVKKAKVRPEPIDRTPEYYAELHQRRYENEHHNDAIKGSRALLAAQVRFNQFPCKLAPLAT